MEIMPPRLLNAVWCLAAALAIALSTSAAAAADICGRPEGTPDQVLERLTKVENLREARRSGEFVAFEDPKDGTLWAFTLAPHPAHPAVVCRRVVERRGFIDIPTTIICKGPEAACAKLKTDFDAVNEKMIQDIYRRQQGPQPIR